MLNNNDYVGHQKIPMSKRSEDKKDGPKKVLESRVKFFLIYIWHRYCIEWYKIQKLPKGGFSYVLYCLFYM